MSNHRLHLPQVTLCAVTSVNIAATLQALETSLEQVSFAACKLLTDVEVVAQHPAIEVVRIEHLGSSAAYSHFLLHKLSDYVETSHCLIAQWDGHVLDARFWQPEFLDYDYIGASWPQFDDGYDVGNGGFSLRSRRLMDLCRDPAFAPARAEDIAIARTNRAWLEGQGMRFAPWKLANHFAAERAGDLKSCFGYHGIWNMPKVVGMDGFWQIYQNLDDRGTMRRDFHALLKEVWKGPRGMVRCSRMVVDRFFPRLR